MQCVQAELLAYAGRLLLEYNESTREIHRTLDATSRALTDEPCDAVISYNGVAISLSGQSPFLMPVRELRYNAALQARVHCILERVCRTELEPSLALDELKRVEAETPRHPRWLAVLFFGLAASSLAALLGADTGTIFVVGLSTGLGLIARQEMGRRHFNLLALPFAAGLIGAFLGGLAFRLGWTNTLGLAVIVPSLMLVPGPHLINGLLDLVDNFVPMGLARLGLAVSILVATAAGVVIGMVLTLPSLTLADQTTTTEHLNLLSDMFLAGIVTVGFAVFYNTSWPHIGMAAFGGIVGHGLRFIALESGLRLEIATLLGGLAVGLVSAWIVRSSKVPIAVISFAGAVTMMPGIQMYRALSGVLQLARLQDTDNFAVLAITTQNASQACLIVAALAMGLVIASRLLPATFAAKID